MKQNALGYCINFIEHPQEHNIQRSQVILHISINATPGTKPQVLFPTEQWLYCSTVL